MKHFLLAVAWLVIGVIAFFYLVEATAKTVPMEFPYGYDSTEIRREVRNIVKKIDIEKLTTDYQEGKKILRRYERNKYTREAKWNNINGFIRGECTAYVAANFRDQITWGGKGIGNAKNWLNVAEQYGYQVTNDPIPGSVVVTSESWYGHVGVVEVVGDQSITISEMNYTGSGVMNLREINKRSNIIKGYIILN